jgi:hypothetical protein
MGNQDITIYHEGQFGSNFLENSSALMDKLLVRVYERERDERERQER